MSTHNICFRVKIRKITYTTVNLRFIIKMWDVMGSTLHGHVSMIFA